MTIEIAIFLLPGLLVGLTLHEFAHAWSASLLGDGFARRQGRVSLNPFRHLSLLGSAAILVLPIGWGKPVPVNLYNFRRPKRDYLLCSLAGPAANLLIVVVCLIAMQLTRHSFALGSVGVVPLGIAHLVLYFAVIPNAALAVLNLLPIPPLDGSKIWPCVLPGLRPTMGGKLSLIWMAALVFLLWTHSLAPLWDGVFQTVAWLTPEADFSRHDDLIRRGDLALAADEPADAQQAYSQALAVYPNSAKALLGRAEARIDLEQLGPALEDLERLRALIPAGNKLSPQLRELRERWDSYSADPNAPDPNAARTGPQSP